jgi:hypothetical protein
MPKRCADCHYYNPVKGEPPAGWCEFTTAHSVPFWMEQHRNAVDRLGADVLANDGVDCFAFESPHQ